MNIEYNRYQTPMLPGSVWPDGSRVSNWSQAVAALNLRMSRTRPVAVEGRQEGAQGPRQNERAIAA